MSYYFYRSEKSLPGLATSLTIAALLLISFLMPRFFAVAAPLAGIVMVCATVKARSFDIPPPRAMLYPFMALILMAGMSMLFSIAPSESLERLSKTTMITAPGLLALSLLPQIRARARILASVYLLALIAIVAQMYGGLSGLSAVNKVLGREITPVVDLLNRHVVAFTLLAPAMLYMMWSCARGRVVAAVTAGFLAALLYGTHSQSAQLAGGVMIAAAFFFPYGCRVSWVALAATLAAGIAAAPFVAPWAFKTLPPLIKGNMFMENGYAANRLEIWDYVSRYALQRPLTGYGMESTRLIKDFDTQYMYQGSNGILHPHNFALQSWMEFGAVGAALAIILVLYVLRAISFMDGGARRVALATFMGALTFASMSYGMWQGWWIGLLIVTAGFVRIAAQKKI